MQQPVPLGRQTHQALLFDETTFNSEAQALWGDVDVRNALRIWFKASQGIGRYGPCHQQLFGAQFEGGVSFAIITLRVGHSA